MLLHFPHTGARVNIKFWCKYRSDTVALISQRMKDGYLPFQMILCQQTDKRLPCWALWLDFHFSIRFFPYSLLAHLLYAFFTFLLHPVEVFQVDYVDLRLSHIFTQVQCGQTESLRATISSTLAAGIKICFEWIYTWSGVITLLSDNWRILQESVRGENWTSLSITLVDGIKKMIPPMQPISHNTALCGRSVPSWQLFNCELF